VLSLHLKHSRTWFGSILLGCAHIRAGELLDRCNNNQRELVFLYLHHSVVSFHIASVTTLTLHDERGREAGSLIVQLRDTTSQAHTATIDGAIQDVEQGLSASPVIPESVQNVIHSTIAIGDLASGVVSSLKQVVDKTRIVVDFVDKTAKVRVAPLS